MPYTLGTILRYASGSTALFRVTHVAHVGAAGSVHYFGQHCMGGLYGAHHDRVIAASSKDVEAWTHHAIWRSSQDQGDEE